MMASQSVGCSCVISSLRMTESREGVFPIILLLDKCVLDLASSNHYDSLVDIQGLGFLHSSSSHIYRVFMHLRNKLRRLRDIKNPEVCRPAMPTQFTQLHD